jgi:hypothetical protein
LLFAFFFSRKSNGAAATRFRKRENSATPTVWGTARRWPQQPILFSSFLQKEERKYGTKKEGKP